MQIDLVSLDESHAGRKFEQFETKFRGYTTSNCLSAFYRFSFAEYSHKFGATILVAEYDIGQIF